MGLPDRTGFTTAKMNLTPPFGPIRSKVSIVTVLEGSPELKGKTYKFEKQFFWQWDEEGKQTSGGKGGEYWPDIPKGGFDTMFHNGNSSKPMIVGFQNDLVYYLTTNGKELEFVDTGIDLVY